MPVPAARDAPLKIVLVHSRSDPAGTTIRQCIDRLLSERPSGLVYPLEDHSIRFHESESRLIFQDHLDQNFAANLIIFLSRHSSEHTAPLLTVHVTGNIGPAELGGIPGSLAVASPQWMHAVLCNLNKYAPPGYRATYEVTHHGPSEISTPSFFVEIGSTTTEWTDPQAGFAVARSILEARPANGVSLIGIGGTHYAKRQTEIALRSTAAFGHIVHSRYASLIDRPMLVSLVKKGHADAAYIDKKAVTPNELRMISASLAELSIPRLSERELVQVQHISWQTRNTIKELAEAISKDCAIEISGQIQEGKPSVISLPQELLDEALRVNREQLMQGIGTLPLVSLSSKGVPLLQNFITTEKDRASVLNDLISLCVTLICSGETTAVEGDRLIISRMRFDPEKARNLGILPGPLFGELMKGRTVNVNGHEITPDMVRTRTSTCIRIPGLERLI